MIILLGMPNFNIEQRDIEQFIKLIHTSETKAVRQKEPEPDFAFQTDGKFIGVEHTQLIRLPDDRGINIMAHYSIADRIMQKAEELYLRTNRFCLMVHVDFKCHYGLISDNPTQLYNNDIDGLSRFISDFAIEHLPLIESSKHFSIFNFESFDWKSCEEIFPEKIDHITITNTSNFRNSCWTANQGGIIPGIFDSLEFKTTLEKKNQKPKNYKGRYSEIWLLMVEDSMNLTTYFHFEDQDEIEIKTSFDKVFILRRTTDTLIQLNTIKDTLIT